MNVLLLSIGNLKDVRQHEIYTDLLREFRDRGHSVYAISTYERRVNKETEFKEEFGIKMLRVKIGNITKCGTLEKGISTVTLQSEFKKAIKKYLSDVVFDLVLYSTPPITLCSVVEYIKKRDGAHTYLMLKDIFPQNALDIGILAEGGVKGAIYKYFKAKEKKLYEISDSIGCMSPANVQYLLEHNPELDASKVGLCPNCIEVQDFVLNKEEINLMRDKYGIPKDKRVFVYGGNLGKPQDVPFIIECLKTQTENKKAYFLIVGDGAEYGTLEKFFNENKCDNMRLMKTMPKDDYDRMTAACDIGLIFLDYRFTIPNYPSRMLAYMQTALPVLACTDEATDIAQTVTDGGFGWWCPSNSPKVFSALVEKIIDEPLEEKKEKSFSVLKEQFDVSRAYELIMERYNRK